MCVKGQPQLLHFSAFVNPDPTNINNNNNISRSSRIENKNKTNRSVLTDSHLSVGKCIS